MMSLLLLLASLSLFQAHAPDNEESRIGLTIYSMADPARFDPKIRSSQGQPLGMNVFGYGWGIPAPTVPGFGVVREQRSIDMDAGLNTLRFTGVATEIDPTTVSFRSLTAPDSTAVLEQSFEYDLIDSSRLFDRYLDRPITIHRESPNGSRTSLTAPLLAREESTATEPGRLVLGGQSEGAPIRIVPIDRNVVEIELPDPDSGLITKPTLSWLVSTDEPGEHDVELGYQTGGLTWRADYNLLVSPDETSADLSAWVSILNESGASYDDARLKLIAGDVRRIEPDQPMIGGGMGGMGGGMAREAEFEQTPFFEYHLYTLGRPTTLPDRSTKQIELFPTRSDVAIETVYVYFGAPSRFRSWFYDYSMTDRDLGTDANTDVDVYLRITNDEEHGLGLPLPAGRVRVSKRDEADGAPEFIGEDVIAHTPRGEEILARLGAAFDIVGDRKQLDYRQVNRNEIHETFRINVRNRKDEPVEVIIREILYRWLNWEITECGHDFEKQDFRTIHIPVSIPAGGEVTVDYTVHYAVNIPRGGFQ